MNKKSIDKHNIVKNYQSTTFLSRLGYRLMVCCQKLLKQELFWLSFLAIFVTIFIFNGVLKGQIISNVNHIYNFEPWIHYPPATEPRGNYIMSDMVDSIGIISSQVDLMREKHEIPLWNYYDKLGSVGIINLFVGLLLPQRIIFWILFGSPVGWTIEIIFNFVLGFIFFYLFLKELNVKGVLAFIVSIGYIFSSNNVATHQGGFAVIPLMAPFLFFAITKLIKTNKWRYVPLVVMSSILVSVHGFLSVSFYFAFWSSVYALTLIFLSREYRKKAYPVLIKLATSLLFTSLLLSFTLLPTLNFFSGGINLNYRKSYGLRQLDVKSLYNVFSAHAFGDPLSDIKNWRYGSYINTSIYVGLITILMALIMLPIRIFRKREIHLLFFIMVSIFLFFDIYLTPVEKIEKISNLLPVFHGNSPTYQKTVLQFLIATAGALGFDYLWELFIKKRNRIKNIYRHILFIVLSGMVFYVYYNIWVNFKPLYTTAHSFSFLHWDIILAVISIAIIGLIIYFPLIYKLICNIAKIVLNKCHKKKIMIILERLVIIMLTAVYLFQSYNHSRNWISYSKTQFWFPKIQMTNYLTKHIGNGRIISLDRVAIPAMMSAYGIPVAAGRGSVQEEYKFLLQTADETIYTSHPTQSFFRPYSTNLTSPIWYLTDTRYFITSRRYDDSKLLKYEGRIKAHNFKGGKLLELFPKPQHAYLVSDAVIYKDIKSMAKDFSNNWDINRQIAFLNKEALLANDTSKDDLKSTPSAQIITFRQQTNRMIIDIENKEPVYLLLSSQYYPGWNAYIDGKKTKIFPAYGFLSSIKIEDRGKHRVEFKFLPRDFIVGSIISLSFLPMFIYLTYKWWKKNI